MSNTDADWEFWGKNDAHYGVLTDKKYISENIENNKEEFFLTGEDYVESRLEIIERHIGKISKNRALDFGCGVGRLVEPLARRFTEVVGLDISPSMLEKARKNAVDHRLNNVTYDLSDDVLTNARGTFDFVHTYIVLQHIPTKRGMGILRGLLERVAPGGVASLHVCVRGDERPLVKAVSLSRRHLPAANGMVNLIRGRSWREPLMQMNIYPLTDVISAFHEAGIAHVIVNTEQHDSFLTAQIAGRKAGVAA